MRAIGNNGHAAISGRRVPVVGRVSMDLTTLDVTGIPPDSLSTDVEAEFFCDAISLEEAARAGNTASYEILTSLTSRVPRHYEGGAA
jgi:alanine racemase